MNANQEIIAELRRVLNERDQAREQLDLTKRELGRWVDRETKAVRERDEALGRLKNEIKAANQARMAEERAREALEAMDAAVDECLPGDDDDAPIDCVERAGDKLRELARERDEARASVADAYRRGVEAMREACTDWVENWENDGVRIGAALRDLPIPEEP